MVATAVLDEAGDFVDAGDLVAAAVPVFVLVTAGVPVLVRDNAGVPVFVLVIVFVGVWVCDKAGLPVLE